MGIYDRDYSREQYDGPRRQIQFAMPVITPVVKWLLIINVAIFIIDFMLDPQKKFFVPHFSVFPAGWQSLQVWRLLTYQFLHEGFGHIFGNMLCLFFFGPILERHWGSKKFLKFYLICGTAGGIFYTLLVTTSLMKLGFLLGASGAIFGILAAGAILFPNMRVYVFGIFPLRLMVLAIILAVYSIMTLFHGPNAGGESAHLAGMAAGAIYVLWPRWQKKVAYKPRKHLKWNHKINQHRALQAEVDQILDKINKTGIASLTRHEKKILRRASQHQQQNNR